MKALVENSEKRVDSDMAHLLFLGPLVEPTGAEVCMRTIHLHDEVKRPHLSDRMVKAPTLFTKIVMFNLSKLLAILALLASSGKYFTPWTFPVLSNPALWIPSTVLCLFSFLPCKVRLSPLV